VPHRMSIDRFEGDRKQIAVLVTEDGEHQINVLKKLLPKGAKAGDVLMMDLGRDDGGAPRVAAAAAAGDTGDMAITKDEAATEDVARKTRKVQEDLKRKDPGGDIEL
jgi:hypothetical protein